jgi:hypothetical protein
MTVSGNFQTVEMHVNEQSALWKHFVSPLTIQPVSRLYSINDFDD